MQYWQKIGIKFKNKIKPFKYVKNVVGIFKRGLRMK